jgi:penicillin-binding protein 1B
VRQNLADLDKVFASRKKDAVPPGTLQAALVALNPKTGEIYAMVGGRDYEASQLNRATDAKRQPGSVFKPIVYATAIESAYSGALPEPITAVSQFLDAPAKFTTATGEIYEPDNFGKSYSNKDVPLREGLVHSLNVVTVRVAEKVGLFEIQRVASKLGLPKPPPYLATALGTTEATPLEVAEAYTAFADLGQRCAPTGMKRVTDDNGATIKALRPDLAPSIHPQTAYIITDFLKDVLNRGTAAGARARGFTALAAGKTGTSRDGWFAGYTPNLVCVVYVGFDDGSQLGLEGAKSALPIWTDFMKTALRLRPDLGGDDFDKPADGIVELDVDPESGGLATPACLTHHTEVFVAGTEPKEPCPIHDSSFSAQPPDIQKYDTPPFQQPGQEPTKPKSESPPNEKPHDGEAKPGERPRRIKPPGET